MMRGVSDPRELAVVLGSLGSTILKLMASVMCAGLFYFLWMGAFIVTVRLRVPILEVVGWLTAPGVTAAGFASGIALFERLTRTRKSAFLHLIAWPLIGCAIGAVAVFPFGPMLIVFGMFLAGTASIILRELVLSMRDGGRRGVA
jgi:hypothetical protein